MAVSPVAVTTMVLRAVVVLCGIAVLALIADKGRFRCEMCIFNSRDEACRLGMAVGAVGFLVGTVLLVIDTIVMLTPELLEERASLHPFVQRALDTLASTALTVVWMACFGLLLREWENRPFMVRRAMERGIPLREIDGQATLALCFINFGLWGALSILALVRWCQTSRPSKDEKRDKGKRNEKRRRRKKKDSEEQASASEVHGNDQHNWYPGAGGEMDFGPQMNANGRERTPSYGNRIYM